jgi:DNA polymerase-3 subunit gamma/tau
MSYEVTATRRRPQKFDDLVGQEFVAETLKNSIKSGKIAHAYLFSGPRGCGKTSTARILAKALNCQNGPTDNPCGTCSTCQEITKGSSLDVIEIDGASNTSVENIRQIKDEVLFPPNSCRYKIYIIDEVHMLSTSAFNALLKTIEEPPAYVIFIFATTELQKVPATIKSRCQQFNFRLVAVEKVKECLAQAAAELNIKADDEALFWIARESTGSMRDAYTLFDQVVAFSDGHITYEKIRDKLGLVGIDRLNMIFESCAYGRSDEVLTSLDEFLQSGISIEQLVSNCADYLRSLMLIKSGITKESLLGNSVERYSKVVLNAWNTIQVERALSIYLQLYKDIRYSLSPRYELELAFSRMCWIGQFVSNQDVKKAIDGARALLESSGATNTGASGGTGNGAQGAQASPAQNFNQGALAQSGQAEKVSGINPVPNGLPRLSMLDNPPEENNSLEDTPPFHDGGPLPPEQSVAESKGSDTEQKTVNEKLIIHAAENVTEEKPVEQVHTMPAPTDYSFNPDSEEDGWTNTEEPPEDGYYEDESQNRDDQYYEESFDGENSNQGAAFTVNNAGNQLAQSQTFTTADGTSMSVIQLRGNVTAALSLTDGFAASVIEKTGEWKINGEEIITTIQSSYDRELLNKKLGPITEEITKICGKQMKFTVNLQEKTDNVIEEKKSENTVPEQVNILLNAFKGTVVAGKV